MADSYFIKQTTIFILDVCTLMLGEDISFAELLSFCFLLNQPSLFEFNQMMNTANCKVEEDATCDYDRQLELKVFDETKAGVKGLVDAGITKIPRIFVHDQVKINHNVSRTYKVPIINFEDIDKDSGKRSETIKEITDACEKWGFFQVVNHGIPVQVMDEMIDGVRKFHEQETEVKKQFYSRDVTKNFTYDSNFDLYSAPISNWRDTMSCIVSPDPPDPLELPIVCREILMEYSEYITKLGVVIFELISEALGLNLNHLKDMECTKGVFLVGHYYPACPEPELTLGTSSHADSGFLTLLIQDQVGSLQVLHENQWVDVPPLHGAVIVNIADLLQDISTGLVKETGREVNGLYILNNKKGPGSTEGTQTGENRDKHYLA